MCLLIIDIPDERLGHRSEFDHMHAWGTQIEMQALKRLLEDQFGGDRRHLLVDGFVCPRCGVWRDDT